MNVKVDSVSVKIIDSYKASKNKYLNDKPCFVITCPYDGGIVEDIKCLDWQQREWNGTSWIILKDDPNQQSDEETNIEFVRRITTDCAKRKGWLLADVATKSEKEVEDTLTAKSAALLENHVAAVLAVLPKLPSHSLRLIRWGKTLKLQLTMYLGEDNKDLFMELHDACTKVWKPQVLASFDPKMQAGFVFEIANDKRIIKALMQCKGGIDYFKVRALQPIGSFDDGVSHLVNKEGERFIGLLLDQVDMSELDFEAQSWQVALVNEDIYWVDSFSTYITSVLEEKDYSVFYRVCIPKQSNTVDIITFFHLEEWFKEWALQVLATDELQEGYLGDLKAKTSVVFWQHPADKLISHIKRFGNRGGEQIVNLIGLTPKEFATRADEINNLKIAYAVDYLQELKLKAREIVINKLISKLDKKGLLQLAEREPVVVKKSWTKEQIASAVVTQEYAFKQLDIA